MILNSRDIQRSVEVGNVVIDPFVPEHLKQASYTFRLGSRIGIPVTQIASIDLRQELPELEFVSMGEEGYELLPGQFVLGYTLERVRLDASTACLLSGRSTCAQAGLDVLQSSTFAEPESDASFVLEMHNSGPYRIRLFPGMKVVKGVFLTTASVREVQFSA